MAGKLKWAFFSLLLIGGLIAAGLAGYFGYRYMLLKKETAPLLDSEDGAQRPMRQSDEFFDARDRNSRMVGGLNSNGNNSDKNILEDSDSDDEFNTSKPRVT